MKKIITIFIILIIGSLFYLVFDLNFKDLFSNFKKEIVLNNINNELTKSSKFFEENKNKIIPSLEKFLNEKKEKVGSKIKEEENKFKESIRNELYNVGNNFIEFVTSSKFLLVKENKSSGEKENKNILNDTTNDFNSVRQNEQIPFAFIAKVGEEISFLINSNGSYKISWGDGKIKEGINNDQNLSIVESHTWEKPGNYLVKIETFYENKNQVYYLNVKVLK